MKPNMKTLKLISIIGTIISIVINNAFVWNVFLIEEKDILQKKNHN